MKRRTTFVVLAVFLLATMSVFSAGKKLVIGRVFFDLSHPYQQADEKHYVAYAKQLGITSLSIDGKSNNETMTNAVDDLIAKGVDGIIVQPLDGSAIAGAVNHAQEQGIPIVVFFENVRGATCPYVRINEHDVAVKMGEIAAKKFKEIWPGKEIKIGLIDAPQVEYVRVHRAGAFVTGVQNVDPTAEVVADLDGQGLRDKSMLVAEDLLQSHPEVNIVYGINDDASLGALAAFQAAGRGKAKNGIPLTEIFVGTGGSTLECLEIVNPKSPLKLTMALSPRDDARSLIDTLLKVINGKIDPKSDVMVDTYDRLINGWTDKIADVQKFVTGEYFAKIDLKKEVGLK